MIYEIVQPVKRDPDHVYIMPLQLKEAMIRACLAYNGVHPITKRVSMNVR